MVVGVLGGRKDRVGRLLCRVDPSGRVLIDATGGPGHVSLRFDADGLGALVPGIDALVLPWDAHGEVPSVMDRRTGDCWMVTSWTSGRGGPMGIGLQVAGAFVERARPLRLATTSWWQRWDQAFSGGDLEGTRLPVLPSSTVFNASRRERETLRALTELLARRHEARTHLTDPVRAARLARDLSGGMVGNPASVDGLGRDQADIATAMKRSGLVYEFGRPLASGAEHHSDAVDRVLAHLAKNPYREDRPIDGRRVEQFVRDHYLALAPWPFAALVD